MRLVRSPRPRLLLLVMLLLLLPPSPIYTAAQDDPLQAGTQTVNVELILDASASMGEQLPEGETRIEAAKRILRQVIADLPEREGVNVGLRIYGHEGDNTEAGKGVSCRSSELLVPVAGLDQAALLAQVEAMQPTGWTPIAYSLEQAAADFQPGGESITNAIVLVTDGEETCDPPEESCAAAAALHQANISVVTHVVGFALTPEQTELVSCVAEEGGGQLFDAEDAEELGTALTEALEEVGIPPALGALTGIHTLAYHQLTAWDVAADHGAEGPVLSDDGQRIVFARSPGLIGTSGESNRIFVINADGSGEREVDAYTSRCCPSVVDLSSDGAWIVSTDGAHLRIAAAEGGGGRQLVALNGGGIDGLRISGDGSRVYFRVAQNDPLPLERGIWVINADASGLRQIVGSTQMEELGLPPDHVFETNGWALDISADGSHLVFGASYGAGKESVFEVNSDGSGLRELVGPVRWVHGVAMSGDGLTVAYHVRDTNDLEQAGVIGFDGSDQRTLADGTTLHPASAGIYVLGYPTDRLGLSADGSRLLLGSTGVLYDTSGDGRLALGVTDAGPPVAAHGPLVREGLYRSTMSADASRVIYLAFHADAPHQLARVDVNPAELGPAPAISEASVTPPYVLAGNRTLATASARVNGTEPLGVGGRVLDAGLPDPTFSSYTLYDDGASQGDAAADGLFTNNGLATAEAVLGPRTVRIKAETVDSDGLLHATAVDVTPFAVVDDFPPEEPATPVAPETATPVSEPVTPVAAQGDLPAAFVGMWQGTAVEANTGEQVLLELELSGGDLTAPVGTYFYPAAECGGPVTLQEVAAGGSQVTLTEPFGFTSTKAGLAPCPTGADATITLTPQAAATLGYAWTDPGSGRSRSGTLSFQDDYGRFVGALAAREGRPGADPDRLAGPSSGELVLACCESTIAGAGVTVENFVASATFTTPNEPAANPMGVGFAFRRAAEMAEQIVIDWGGSWNYWPAPEGNVRAGDIRTAWGAGLPFDGTPGSTNTIDLVVDGETALFGVNGLFVAKIELLHPIGAGDVEVAAFWGAGSVEGTTISYRDFQVWAVPAASAPVEPATVTPVPEPATPVSEPVTPVPEPGTPVPPEPATPVSEPVTPMPEPCTCEEVAAAVAAHATQISALEATVAAQATQIAALEERVDAVEAATVTPVPPDGEEPQPDPATPGPTDGAGADQDPLQVHFALSGGGGGYQDELALDTADLPEAEATELRRLIAEADFWNLPTGIDDGVPITDGFQYRVTVTMAGRSQTVTAYDGEGIAEAQYPDYWILVGWLAERMLEE